MHSQKRISILLVGLALFAGCASSEKKHAERELNTAQAQLHEAYEDAELAQKALGIEMAAHTRLVEALSARGDRSRSAFSQLLSHTRAVKIKYARIVDIQHYLVRKVILCSRKQKALGLEYKKERLIFEQTPADQKDRSYQLKWRSIKILEDQQAEHSQMSLLIAKTHLLQATASIKEISEFEELEREILEKLEK